MTEPQVPAGPLARYHRALPRLAVLLRGADLAVGADRWQNLYDLLLALNAQGRLPARADGLEPLMAPLLCRSAREQEQFAALFARWLADLEPDQRGEGEVHEWDPVPPGPEPEPPPVPRLRRWLSGLVLVLVALGGGAYWWNLRTETTDTKPVPSSEAPPALAGSEARTRLAAPPELALQAVPPRTPREAPSLDPIHRAWLATLGDALLGLPAVLALAWLLLRWLTWKTVLERRKGDPEHPLTAIGLDRRADDLLDAPALRDALKRLHTPVRVLTRRLDVDATVARSARHAGLFQPVQRDRRTVPELVVLLEQRHVGDQMAGLAAQLLDRLRAAGLTLHRYDYRGSPRRLIGCDGRWRTLAEVAARHEGARLLLIGEPDALIDRFSGEPLPWGRAMAPWPWRGLLVTRRPPERWQLALADSGFVVAELDSAGVHTLVRHFSDRRAAPDLAFPKLTVPLPRLLQDGRRWVQPVTPSRADQETLLAALHAYLGEDGRRLLTAMAAYPQLHWGLTRLLDLSLSPGGDPVERERRLLKVARLPWCRAGWLPDWLRSSLLGELDRPDERAIRRLYRALLQRETATGGGLALPVSLPRRVGLWEGLWDGLRHKSWRLDRWLAALRTLSAEHGTLNDAIFAGVLFGWRPRLLDFVLPRGLLRRRMGGALGQALAPRLVLATLIAVGGAWLADRLWDPWGRDEVAKPRLLALQNAAHGAYRVRIWHLQETAELARALDDTLKADGFDSGIAETVLAPPPSDAQSPPPANKIQWGDAADVELATHVEQRLMYLTWGHDPEVTNKLGPLAAALPDLAQPPPRGALRVLLLTPGVTGSAFADPLARTLTPERIAGILSAPQPSQEAAPGEKPKPFRDVLRDGGEAPEMVPLPGGSFRMGCVSGEGCSADERPVHAVTIRPFAIGRNEVSFADYDRFAEATGRTQPDDERWGRGRRPVINVSWHDAVVYAEWLSEQTGKRYRLPSEAEWEYVARAGTETPFWSGACIHTDQANYAGDYDFQDCGAKTGVYRRKTVETGSLPANPWGLHEVAGNVWEWVQDCWHDSYEGAPADGSAREYAEGEGCARRVVRGGGWGNRPEDLRSAYRNRNAPGGAFYDWLGFRLARDL